MLTLIVVVIHHVNNVTPPEKSWQPVGLALARMFFPEQSDFVIISEDILLLFRWELLVGSSYKHRSMAFLSATCFPPALYGQHSSLLSALTWVAGLPQPNVISQFIWSTQISPCASSRKLRLYKVFFLLFCSIAPYFIFTQVTVSRAGFLSLKKLPQNESINPKCTEFPDHLAALCSDLRRAPAV